jgi:hypothetical protein
VAALRRFGSIHVRTVLRLPVVGLDSTALVGANDDGASGVRALVNAVSGRWLAWYGVAETIAASATPQFLLRPRQWQRKRRDGYAGVRNQRVAGFVLVTAFRGSG